jgi:hypothetical protein
MRRGPRRIGSSRQLTVAARLLATLAALSTLTAATGLSGALSGLSAFVALSGPDLSGLIRPISLTTLSGLPTLTTDEVDHIDPFAAGEGAPAEGTVAAISRRRSAR